MPRTSTDGDVRGLEVLRRPLGLERRVPDRSAIPASGDRERDPSELGGEAARLSAAAAPLGATLVRGGGPVPDAVAVSDVARGPEGLRSGWGSPLSGSEWSSVAIASAARRSTADTASGSPTAGWGALSPSTSEGVSSWVGAHPSEPPTWAVRSTSQSKKVTGSLLKSGVSIPVS
eukprot:14465686-Alexandrium_andersonii.AAC.1